MFFSTTVVANSSGQTQYYSFLENGFIIDDYTACKALAAKCPFSNGSILPDESCVIETLHANKVCWQFEKLAHVLDFTPNSLFAQEVNGFTIIDLVTMADGQDNYYIISKGYLIDTNIDPRQLSAKLARKYKKTSFGVFNWGEPHYQKNADGSRTFSVILKITDICLGCPVVGWATINFNFDKAGYLLNTQLRSFTTKPLN